MLFGIYNYSKKICTILFSWYKYHNRGLPIEDYIALDFSQDEISLSLQDVLHVCFYMGGLVIINDECRVPAPLPRSDPPPACPLPGRWRGKEKRDCDR